MLDTGPLTDVGGPQPAACQMVAHGHPVAADAADDEALQQRRAFTRRTAPAIRPDRLRVLSQTSLIRLEVGPADVAGMRIGDQRGPLLARQTFGDVAEFRVTPLARAAKEEGAGVPRVMQDPQRARVLERRPQHVARVRAMTGATRKQQLLRPEGLDRGHGRPGPAKRLEEGAQRALDLLIGIEDHACGRVIDEADRQRRFEFAAPGLVQNAAA